jgi:putative spermidine/putrescine transport system permease protein
MKRDWVKIVLGIYTVFIIFIFYLPLILVAILSFKSDASITFPILGFSLYWYIGPPGLVGTSGFTSGIFYDPQIGQAIINSITLGVITAVIVVPLVICAALTLRYAFKGRDLIFYLLLAGFVMPAIIIGLGANIFYKTIGITEYSIWTVLPLHIVYTMPFGLILTMARFDPLMVEYENVARVLGASGWKVFTKITFPLIRTQVISTFFFAFTLSLSEFLRSSFVIAGVGTIPTYVYNQMSVTAPTPKWFALGTLSMAISLTLLFVVAYILTRGQRRII